MASAGVGSCGREAIREVRGKTVYILLPSTSRVHVNAHRPNPFLSLRLFQGTAVNYSLKIAFVLHSYGP
mgnify:CR=1 FL=1|jgi:hypothetical protein